MSKNLLIAYHNVYPMIATAIWFWSIAVVSTIVLSAGFSVIGLTSEGGPETLLMLPLELQPGSPPSFLSRLLIGLMWIALVAFYGSLIALMIFSSWIQALIGGGVLFYTQFKSQGWWIRNTECRPMKPMLLSAVVLMMLIVVACVDIFLV